MSLLVELMTDGKPISIWSMTHLLFGYFFFVILHNYFKISVTKTIIILVILHAIYEWKDFYVTYFIYDNDERKMNAAHEIVYENSYYFRYLSKLGIGAGFHLPPNNINNTIGDTLFQLLGIWIGYYFKNNISNSTIQFAIWISIIYWLLVLIAYIQVISLNLHNKTFVDKL